MVWMRQSSLPVFASKAATMPRAPKSPPAVPTITLSFTIVGAMGDGVALAGLRHLCLPQELAGLRVERHEMRVERAHVDHVAEHGDAAIHAPTAVARVRQVLVRERPVRAARHRIERHHVVRRLHRIEDAVHDNRRRLVLLERLGLPDPLELEVLDVGGVLICASGLKRWLKRLPE
jgi:hypothetical protein